MHLCGKWVCVNGIETKWKSGSQRLFFDFTVDPVQKGRVAF